MLSPAAFVDRLAADVPHNVWVKTPLDQAELAWQDVTYLQLSRAVDSMAYWIERELGLAAADEPLAYAGVNDIRYPIIILAALKTGYKSLLVCPRNSREGNLSLLKSTGCTKFMFGAEFGTQFNDLATEGSDLKLVQVPSLQQLLADTDGPRYEGSSPEEIQDHETVTIVHSSGTTGHPKPVYIKAGVFRVASKVTSMPVPKGRQNASNELYGTELLLSPIPLFHIFGTILIVRSIYHQGPLVMLPPGKPPTAELLLNAITTTKPTRIGCPPSLLEDICNLPTGLDTLAELEVVFFGGAPLADACGDKITKVTRFINSIGSTETFNLANLIPADPADWQYLEWNPHGGLVMEPTADNPRLAELVIQRLPESDFQSVFHNFPDHTEWRTKDLFEQHPTKPALWKYIGRADDTIVLSNGLKVNPVSFEKAVEGHPWVRGALVVGTGQFQTGLLIEPHAEWAAVGKEAFVDGVWRCVEEANAQCPAHARVWRSMVTLAVPDKPFKRTPKGSVMRQGTCRVYEEEIKLLYCGQPLMAEGAELGGDKVRNVVRRAVRSVLGTRAEHVADDTDLFSLGADSLQVLQLCQVLSSSGVHCTTRMVYNNSSIDLLSRAVSSGRNDHDGGNIVSREEKMFAMIHRHTKFARETAKPASPERSSTLIESICAPGTHSLRKKKAAGRCVLLIGSTGTLGTHLLHELMGNSNVDRVYCLNRSENAVKRQTQAFFDRGLGSVKFDDHPKVHFLQGETYQENFGLSTHEYAMIEHGVDLVILNAWPVNFNSSLESFESVIAGTKRSAEFAASSRRHPHIDFVSSVASVLNFPAVRRRDGESVLLVPEEFDPDNSLPSRQGYGESKHVASAILAKAVKDLSIGATVLRVGQLAGTANGTGVWNKHEWLPTLIKTSRSLGKIPGSLGPASGGVVWVPVDIAAKSILELVPVGVSSSQAPHESKLRCFNVVNPSVMQWSDLVAVVQQHFAEQGPSRGRTIEAVGFGEWLDELRAMGTTSSAEEIDRYPGLKLLDFFEEMRSDEKNGQWGVATAQGIERSAAMAELGAVDAKLMQKWLREWEF